MIFGKNKIKLFLLSKSSIFGFKVIIAVLTFWLLAHSSQLKFGLIYTIFDNLLLTLLIIGFLYLTVITNTWRWYRLNSVQGIQFSIFHTIMPSYLGMAFNNVLPGSVGGDVFRLYYIMKKFPAQKSGVALSVFLDRVSGLMGIFIIVCVMSLYHVEIFEQNDNLFSMLLLSTSGCGIGIFIFFIGLNDWLIKKFPNMPWVSLISSLLRAASLYRNSKWVIVESILVSILSQFILLISILLINKMLGLPSLSPATYMLALAVGQVANLVPLTPGGLGIGEVAFAKVLLIINPHLTAAYATVFFVLRLLSTIIYLPGVAWGIFGYHPKLTLNNHPLPSRQF